MLRLLLATRLNYIKMLLENQAPRPPDKLSGVGGRELLLEQVHLC